MELPSPKSKIVRLSLFYAIAIGCLIYIEASGKFKSGPCTPNLDILAPLLLIIVTVILLITSLVNILTKRGNKYLLMINLAAFLALVFVLLRF